MKFFLFVGVMLIAFLASCDRTDEFNHFLVCETNGLQTYVSPRGSVYFDNRGTYGIIMKDRGQVNTLRYTPRGGEACRIY